MRMNEERVCHLDEHLDYERDNDYWNEICESEIYIDQPTDYICDDYESMYPMLPSMTDENLQLFRRTFLDQNFSGVAGEKVACGEGHGEKINQVTIQPPSQPQQIGLHSPLARSRPQTHGTHLSSNGCLLGWSPGGF